MSDELEEEAVPEAEAAGEEEVATSIVLPVREAEETEAEPKSRRDDDDADTADEFDPGDATVEDVLAYVEANPEEADRVLAAEKEGKNRSTLVSQLEAPDE